MELLIILWQYIQMEYKKILLILLISICLSILLKIIKKTRLIHFKGIGIKGQVYRGLLSISISVIFVMTLYGRSKGNYDICLIPLKTYLAGFIKNNPEILLQIFMNIVLYVPLGFSLPCCFKIFEKAGYVFWVSLACSSAVEGVQGIMQIGFLEIDDIINNVIGAMLGMAIYKASVKLRNYIKIRGKDEV